MRVYVSGPITLGDRKHNIFRAIVVAEKIFRAGHFPYVPHLNEIWNQVYGHTWDECMKIDVPWITVCHAVVRIPGESRGADIEEKIANEWGIPVYTIEEFLKRFGR